MPTEMIAVTLETITCGKCGVIFGIESGHLAHLRNSGQEFFCINGHGRVYRETEADRLRKQLEAEKKRVGMLRDMNSEAARRIDTERKAHAATKGQLTKTRKRIGNGVCPCCNRHFANVERHMAGQHPDFVAEADHS